MLSSHEHFPDAVNAPKKYSGYGSSYIGKIMIATLAALPFTAGCTPDKPDIKRALEDRGRVRMMQKEEPTNLDVQLQNSLKGSMHGVIPSMDMYVLSLPIAGEHGIKGQASLIPANERVRALLGATKRFQEVTIKGKLLRSRRAPIPHIVVEEIEVGKEWTPEVHFAYTRESESGLVDDLKGVTSMTCAVHAVIGDQEKGTQGLVVEYKGKKYPIFLPKGDPQWQLVKNLWSSSKMRIAVRVRETPGKPPHLEIDSNSDRPLEVIDDIQSINKKEISAEGSLVLYPKSPATTFVQGKDPVDVWGIKVDLGDGVHRFYALYDKDDFEKIDEKVRALWLKKTEGFTTRASNFYHDGIRIRVKGVVQQFGQNQGNPIINLKAADIEMVE